MRISRISVKRQSVARAEVFPTVESIKHFRPVMSEGTERVVGITAVHTKRGPPQTIIIDSIGGKDWVVKDGHNFKHCQIESSLVDQRALRFFAKQGVELQEPQELEEVPFDTHGKLRSRGSGSFSIIPVPAATTVVTAPVGDGSALAKGS